MEDGQSDDVGEGGGRYRRKGVTNSEIHRPNVERWIYSARLLSSDNPCKVYLSDHSGHTPIVPHCIPTSRTPHFVQALIPLKEGIRTKPSFHTCVSFISSESDSFTHSFRRDSEVVCVCGVTTRCPLRPPLRRRHR